MPEHYEFQIQFDSVYDAKQYTSDDVSDIDNRELWLKHQGMKALGSMDAPYFFAVKEGFIDTFPMYDELVIIAKGPGLMYKAVPVKINNLSKIVSHEMIEFAGKKVVKIISSYQIRFEDVVFPLEKGQHITLIDIENNTQLCSFEFTQCLTYSPGEQGEFTEAENYLFEIGKNTISFYLANEIKGENEITPSNKNKLLKKGAKPTFYMEYMPLEQLWVKRGR